MPLAVSWFIWVEFGIFCFQDAGLSPAELQKITVKRFLTILVKSRLEIFISHMKDFTVTSISWAGEMQDSIYTDTELSDRVPQERAEAPQRDNLWETGIKEYSCDLTCSARMREFSAVSAIHHEGWAFSLH